MMKSIILAVFYVSAEFTFWSTADSARVCCVQNKQKRRQCSVKNTAQFCLNSKITTVEPRYNEPNEVIGITNDILRPSNSKLYGTEPSYGETSL